MLTSTKNKLNNSMCFERSSIVRIRFIDPAYARFNGKVAAEAEVGILNPLRNHLNRLYPRQKIKLDFQRNPEEKQ